MFRSRSPVVIIAPVILLLLTGFVLLVAGCVQSSSESVQVTPSPVPVAVPSLTISTPANPTGTDVNVTINSVLQTNNVHGVKPSATHMVFIIVNLTIINNRAENYSLTPSVIKLNNFQPIQDQIVQQLERPVSWGTIQPKEIITGEVIFEVPERGGITLVIFNTDGTALFMKDLNKGSIISYDLFKSEKLRSLMSNNNFTDVIQQLDTPLLTGQYIDEKFTFFDDGSCKGYTPQEFFVSHKGDCSDFAGFFAYTLVAHGYDAKKVSFKYYLSDGSRMGHVVAAFTDKDGQLKYASTPDMSRFQNVSSLDDIIIKEKARLRTGEIIGNYVIHDPASSDVCTLDVNGQMLERYIR